jgi:signal transduction histidine kinase
LTAAEVVGQPPPLPPDPRRDALRAEQPAGAQAVAHRKDGGEFLAEWSVAPLRDERGGVTHCVLVQRDVTEQQRARSGEKHRERLAAIGGFAAGIAHEMNNPLGSLMLAADWALAARTLPQGDAVVVKALGDIKAEAKRCGQIVKALLQFARRGEPERAPHNLNEVVHAALALLGKYARDNGVALTFQPGEPMPAALLSPAEMQQAVVSVLQNAIESGTTVVHVSTELDLPEGRVLLSVTDRGRGIPADARARLFDPFFTTRRKEGRTGLGLSLAHGIVLGHGGSIDVASTPGEGTVVRIRLPLPGSASPAPAGSGGERGGG